MSRCVTLDNVGPKKATVGNVGPKALTVQNHKFTAFLAISPRHRHRSVPVGTGAKRHRHRPIQCRCLTTNIDRHRPLETRYGPAQTGPRLVPVQASWGRSGAGLNRSVPMPVSQRDRKKCCILNVPKKRIPYFSQ